MFYAYLGGGGGAGRWRGGEYREKGERLEKWSCS
jgi:hypothetical protein